MNYFYRILSVISIVAAFIALFLFAGNVESNNVPEAFLYLLLMFSACALFVHAFTEIQEDEK